MSLKNELQEYFQAKGLPLPKYDTERAGGSAHDPQWICRLQVVNPADNQFITVYRSDGAHPSKRAAELSAAANALEDLKRPLEKKRIVECSDGSALILLIDAENQPSAASQFYDTFNVVEYLSEERTVEVHAFVSEGHPVAGKLKSLRHPSFKLHSIPTSRPNGADAAMILYIGKLIAEKHYDCNGFTIAIITSDKFGPATAECAQFMASEDIKSITHYRSLDQFIQHQKFR